MEMLISFDKTSEQRRNDNQFKEDLIGIALLIQVSNLIRGS